MGADSHHDRAAAERRWRRGSCGWCKVLAGIVLLLWLWLRAVPNCRCRRWRCRRCPGGTDKKVLGVIVPNRGEWSLLLVLLASTRRCEWLRRSTPVRSMLWIPQCGVIGLLVCSIHSRLHVRRKMLLRLLLRLVKTLLRRCRRRRCEWC